MPRWLGFVLIAGLLLFPSSASAQGVTNLEEINIELWSEYDQPTMLVIYQFLVSPETPLPAEITLRFPKDSNLIAVAFEHEGDWFNKDVTQLVEQGDWQTIKIKVESRVPHRIEYYQPLLQDGNTRTFKYRWLGDYSVRLFHISVKLPGDSKELVSSPPLENLTRSSDGQVITGTVTKSNLKMMNSFPFELQYRRASSTLIHPATAEVVPATPVDENTPGRVSVTNLPWIIGGFGLALIGIALISYWRSTQSGESQPRKRLRQKREEPAEGQAYCHECGTRAQAGDRFCRTCGSRLRVE